jgi:hypothetical protein
MDSKEHKMAKFSKEFVQAIHNTWQAISPDMIASVEEWGEELDDESAVEGCIDADSIVIYGGEKGKAAQEEFRARMHIIGYPKALKEAMASLPYPLM